MGAGTADMTDFEQPSQDPSSKQDTARAALEIFQQEEELRIALGATERSKLQLGARKTNTNGEEHSPLQLDNVNAFSKLCLNEESESETESPDDESYKAGAGPENGSGLARDAQAGESFQEGLIRDLPDVLVEEILMYVGEYYFSRFKIVSKAWNKFFDGENLFKSLCKYFFVRPAYIPVATSKGRPRKFISWRECFEQRKRVRCCGLYVHKHKYIRDPGPRTMWSPDDHSKFVEVTHYRYILFLRDGTALYASTPTVPQRMRAKFRTFLRRANLSKGEENAAAKFDNALDTENEQKWSSKVEPDLSLDFKYKEGGALHRNQGLKNQKQIYVGSYKVRNREIVLVVDLQNYTIKFHFEIDSNEIIVKTKHQSLWHSFGEEAMSYPLEDYRYEREFRYRNLF
mmetsp:Transcript_11780/g.13571  ORF Transcript_11780/g.13571 Transcript_11780/m.13571 type:complete len:401 (-) Transcript_11780:1272-2474(-)